MESDIIMIIWERLQIIYGGKATVREAISKMVKQSANLSISDAGRNMLREMASKFEPDSDYTNVRELTIQKYK